MIYLSIFLSGVIVGIILIALVSMGRHDEDTDE